MVGRFRAALAALFFGDHASEVFIERLTLQLVSSGGSPDG